MESSQTSIDGGEHWMASAGGVDGSPDGASYTSRFVGIGASVPVRRLSSDELMASTEHRTDIELERLTGVRERRIVGAGEDSYTLALGAARDALAHAGRAGEDLDVLIVSSITRYVGGLRMQLEPPLSVSLKEALGAQHAMSFDLANACAGMMTGVFILNDLIRQGRIRLGMVVSGEYISQLGRNAAREIRTIASDQLASRVAWQCRSPYEWQQHVPIALRVGLTPDEVAGVAGRAPAGAFTERQRALLAVSDELLARRALSDATWSAVQATLRDREAIELCLLIGHYQGLASTIGALGIQLEPGPAGPS